MSRGGGAGKLGKPSLNPRWQELLLRQGFRNLWHGIGSLYGGLGWDDFEADLIRDECEARGLPMGYGRVTRAPIQLNDEEARAQFRAGRRWK